LRGRGESIAAKQSFSDFACDLSISRIHRNLFISSIK